MPSAINGLTFPLIPPAPPQVAADPPASAEPPLFQNLLMESLGRVESLQQSAQTAVEKGLAGGDITQVEVMTAMKKADLALRMMLQIRNKILDAYNEIQQLRM